MTRPLPHNVTAEASVLGTLLVHPGAVDQVAGVLRPEDCYVPAHQELLRAALDLAAEGQPIDLTTLEAALSKAGRLQRVGGVGAIAALAEHATIPDALPAHCRVIRDLATLRNMARVGDEFRARACSGEEEAEALVRDAIEALRGCYRAELRCATGSELVAAHVAACEFRWNNPEQAQPLGVPTGFPVLDEFLVFSGLPRGHVTIVAADTSKGKSALAQAFMRHACKVGQSALDVTLEDKQGARMVRHISAESGLQNKKQQNQTVEKHEWMIFAETCGEVARWSKRMRFIDRDHRGMPVDDLLSAAHRIVDQYEIDLACFDYLQLIPSGQTQLRGTQQHVDYVFDRLEEWAARHPETATIVVSQMHRRDPAVRPELRDLYHSAKLEQGAHTVILIWAARPKHGETYNCRAIDVAKQKDGPTGLLVLGWEGKTVRWFSADEVDAEKYLTAIGGAA